MASHPFHGMLVFAAAEQQADRKMPCAPPQLFALLTARLRQESFTSQRESRGSTGVAAGCVPEMPMVRALSAERTPPSNQAVAVPSCNHLVAVFPDASTTNELGQGREHRHYLIDMETLHPLPPGEDQVGGHPQEGGQEEIRDGQAGVKGATAPDSTSRRKRKGRQGRRTHRDSGRSQHASAAAENCLPPWEEWRKPMEEKWRAVQKGGGAPLHHVIVVIIRVEDFLCGGDWAARAVPRLSRVVPLLQQVIVRHEQRQRGTSEREGHPPGCPSGPRGCLASHLIHFPSPIAAAPPEAAGTHWSCSVVATAFLLDSLYFHRWCDTHEYLLPQNGVAGGQCGRDGVGMVLHHALKSVGEDATAQRLWRAAMALVASQWQPPRLGSMAELPDLSSAHAESTDGPDDLFEETPSRVFVQEPCRRAAPPAADGFLEGLQTLSCYPYASSADGVCSSTLRVTFDCLLLAHEANRRRHSVPNPSPRAPCEEGGCAAHAQAEDMLAAAQRQCVQLRQRLSSMTARFPAKLSRRARRQAAVRQRVVRQHRLALLRQAGPHLTGALAVLKTLTLLGKGQHEPPQSQGVTHEAEGSANQSGRKRTRGERSREGCVGTKDHIDSVSFAHRWLLRLLEPPSVALDMFVDPSERALTEDMKGRQVEGKEVEEGEACELVDLAALREPPLVARNRTAAPTVDGCEGKTFPHNLALPEGEIGAKLKETLANLFAVVDGDNEKAKVPKHEARKHAETSVEGVRDALTGGSTQEHVRRCRQQAVHLAVHRHRQEIHRVLHLCERLPPRDQHSPSGQEAPTLAGRPESEESDPFQSAPAAFSACLAAGMAQPPHQSPLLVGLLRQLWRSIANSASHALAMRPEEAAGEDDDEEDTTKMDEAAAAHAGPNSCETEAAAVAAAAGRAPCEIRKETTGGGGGAGEGCMHEDGEHHRMTWRREMCRRMTAAEAFRLYMQRRCISMESAAQDCAAEGVMAAAMFDLPRHDMPSPSAEERLSPFPTRPSLGPQHLLFLLSFGAHAIPEGVAGGTGASDAHQRSSASLMARRSLLTTLNRYQASSRPTLGAKTAGARHPSHSPPSGPSRSAAALPLFVVRELSLLAAEDMAQEDLAEVLAAVHVCMWRSVCQTRAFLGV